MFTYLDLVGVKTLQTIAADYAKLDIQVIFANCKSKSERLGSKIVLALFVCLFLCVCFVLFAVFVWLVVSFLQ